MSSVVIMGTDQAREINRLAAGRDFGEGQRLGVARTR